MVSNCHKTHIFSSKNKWKGHKRLYIHISAVLQCRHFLGHSQSLRLETTTNYNLQRKGVSARTWNCKYPEKMRLSKQVPTRLKQMHTRVKKVDRLSKKDVAKHVDWWQSGGGRQTMFFQLYWTADTQIPPRPQSPPRTHFVWILCALQNIII